MVSTSELVAKIIDLTNKDKILWQAEIALANHAEYKDIYISVGEKSGWSLKDSLLKINGVKIEGVNKKEMKQLSNAVAQNFKRSSIRQKEKKRRSCNEAINILMEAE